MKLPGGFWPFLALIGLIPTCTTSNSGASTIPDCYGEADIDKGGRKTILNHISVKVAVVQGCSINVDTQVSNLFRCAWPTCRKITQQLSRNLLLALNKLMHAFFWISADVQTKPAFRLEVTLDPTAELWTSPGTYKSVSFFVSLIDNNQNINISNSNETTRSQNVSFLVSNNERILSNPEWYAEFVTSLRPKSLFLRPSQQPRKVTLTIFAPDYVGSGAQVVVTLSLQVLFGKINTAKKWGFLT